jgi:hypothetical protein
MSGFDRVPDVYSSDIEGKQVMAGKCEQKSGESIEGMGGGIAGPSEAGAAGTAAGGTAVQGVDGEAGAREVPVSDEEEASFADAAADALAGASGKRQPATDELADRETGSPGPARKPR